MINEYTSKEPYLLEERNPMKTIISEKQILAALRAINAAGPSPISENIFRKNVIPGFEKEAARAVAIANYVAAVSPARLMCDWYTVALLSCGVRTILMPEAENDVYTEYLLQSAGIPNKHTKAIHEANSLMPAGDLCDLALSIRFAEIHTDNNGRYVRLKDGIRFIKRDDTKGIERELMKLCYELEKRGKYEKYLAVLSELCEGGSYGRQEEDISRQPEMEASVTAS